MCALTNWYALPYMRVSKTALRFVCFYEHEQKVERVGVTSQGQVTAGNEWNQQHRAWCCQLWLRRTGKAKNVLVSVRLTLLIITFLCLDIDLKATRVINNAQVLGAKAYRCFSTRNHRFELMFLVKTSWRSHTQKCSRPSLLDLYSHKKQTYSILVTRLRESTQLHFCITFDSGHASHRHFCSRVLPLLPCDPAGQ